MKALSLVLCGMPGSGKGTQARRLAARHALASICTGDLVRNAISCGGPHARTLRDLINNGELVPDELIAEMVEQRVRACRNQGIVMDGFPQTEAQRVALDEILLRRHRQLHLVVELVVPEELLLQRIAGRFNCAACSRSYHDRFAMPRHPGACDECGGTRFTRRDDDTPAVLRKRLSNLAQKIVPVLSEYRARGLVLRIDGQLSIEEVTRRIASALPDGPAELGSAGDLLSTTE
jgi:adenylate kinase